MTFAIQTMNRFIMEFYKEFPLQGRSFSPSIVTDRKTGYRLSILLRDDKLIFDHTSGQDG